MLEINSEVIRGGRFSINHTPMVLQGGPARCRRVVRLPSPRSFESRSEFFRDGFSSVLQNKISLFYPQHEQKQVSKQDSKVR